MKAVRSSYGKFPFFSARAACSAACFAIALVGFFAAGASRSHSERMRFIVLSKEQHDSGWVVDHKWPLCAGGCDCAENMQWEERAQSLAKDRDERRLCNHYIVPETFTERWHVAPMVAPCPCTTAGKTPDAP